MTHPLCNVEQSLDWLMKPVGKLISRIYTSKKWWQTRSSLHDVAVGQNILLHSLRIQASDFISPDDDVSLIDFVENDPIKKIWHCSDVKNSDMLSLCIMTSYNESAKMDKKQFSTQPSYMHFKYTVSCSIWSSFVSGRHGSTFYMFCVLEIDRKQQIDPKHHKSIRKLKSKE